MSRRIVFEEIREKGDGSSSEESDRKTGRRRTTRNSAQNWTTRTTRVRRGRRDVAGVEGTKTEAEKNVLWETRPSFFERVPNLSSRGDDVGPQRVDVDRRLPLQPLLKSTSFDTEQVLEHWKLSRDSIHMSRKRFEPIQPIFCAGVTLPLSLRLTLVVRHVRVGGFARRLVLLPAKKVDERQREFFLTLWLQRGNYFSTKPSREEKPSAARASTR